MDKLLNEKGGVGRGGLLTGVNNITEDNGQTHYTHRYLYIY